MIELLLGKTTKHESAGVDAGHRVTLEENQIAIVVGRRCMPEMREAYIVEGRGRGEGGNMTAHVGMFISANNHRHGVPANIGVNLDLHVRIARILGLQRRRNRVDVFRGCRVGDINALAARFRD